MGSFLGVNLDDDDERISPLGYVDIIRMHPMDFEEYLWAMGIKKELISEVSDNICSETEVQEYFNRAMIEHYRRFLVIGGMPEAVRTYAETQDYVKVSAVLDNIITVMKKDTGRYSRKADVRRSTHALIRSRNNCHVRTKDSSTGMSRKRRTQAGESMEIP